MIPIPVRYIYEIDRKEKEEEEIMYLRHGNKYDRSNRIKINK